MRLLLLLLSFNLYAYDIYSHKMKDIDGKSFDFADLKGKVVLFVNVAMKDGYVNHLSGMEVLYKKYKDNGFVIIGIPSNDFGRATPDGNRSIAAFMRNTYSVSFPLLEKSALKGMDRIPLYNDILKAANKKKVEWNFVKFLFDKEGKFNYHYEAFVEMNTKRVEQRIRKLLGLKIKEEKKKPKKIKNQYL
jgi:glutathione peroxidase